MALSSKSKADPDRRWDYKPPARKISRQFAADDYGGGFIRFEGGVGLQNHDEHQVCYFRRVSVSSL